MPDKISVLLVDDHSLVRRGFRRILEDEGDIDVTGEASDGEEAVRLAQKLRPKVVLMDCALPGMNGLDATRKILKQLPGTLILMLSMHEEETLVRQAVEAGARGYILKNAMDLDLGAAIRRVAAGEDDIGRLVLHINCVGHDSLRNRNHADAVRDFVHHPRFVVVHGVDGDGFEAQQKSGEIACPECGQTAVEKAVMAPRVGRSRETGSLF